MRFLISRHLHTEKNLQDRHGSYHDATLTDLGNRELAEMLRLCRQNSITDILVADTHQCKLTADLIAAELDVRVKRLELSPYSLGPWRGLSSLELMERNSALANQLISFRLRASNMRSDSWSDLEQPSELAARIKEWSGSTRWPPDGQTLLIGSSSILTVLSNLIFDILPTDESYYNVPFSTGSPVRISELRSQLDNGIWPEVLQHQVKVSGGVIAVTEHKPSVSAMYDCTAFLIPGAFGNSRSGPYGLYTRLASSLAQQGIRSFTVDPLGCGESTQVPRTLESDRRSVLEAINVLGRGASVLIGHSTGANLVYCVHAKSVIAKVLLAPITSYSLAKSKIGFVEDIRSGFCTHHGVSVQRDIIDNEIASFAGHDRVEEMTYFCAGDRYTDPNEYKDRVHKNNKMIYAGGDHNFSTTEISSKLISDVTQSVKTFLIKEN